MQWSLPITIKKPERFIQYGEKLLLIGSCFTEHIGKGLGELKFDVLQNPHGILFGPDAVCKALDGYCLNYQYQLNDLFQLDEVWYSWDHHSRYADTDRVNCLHKINQSQQQAYDFVRQTDWVLLTLGSSFCYRLTAKADRASKNLSDRVANCHRAPADWFTKELIPVAEITAMVRNSFTLLRQVNPNVRIMLTVSPVRHVRDGVQDNNRSKSRLFEAIQLLEEEGLSFYYFPAYELVVDILRDYRFYDVDLVHPNYAATEFVMDHFLNSCMSEETLELVRQIKKLSIAYRHRPQQPNTSQHRHFMRQQWQKARELQDQFPLLNFQEEIRYFESGK